MKEKNVSGPLRVGANGPVDPGKTTLVEVLCKRMREDLVFIESGGDKLAASFSLELSDLTTYVIDVAGGEKIPRKDGPGITKTGPLVINKIRLAPHVGASLEVAEHDARRMRGERTFVMTNLETGVGLDTVIGFIERQGC